jgi:N-dimethylarginine dimethylaminohydrolase
LVNSTFDRAGAANGSSPPIVSNAALMINVLKGSKDDLQRPLKYRRLSARNETSGADAVEELRTHIEVIPLYLGPNVMHLDTRMTILPGRRLLIFPGAFRADDLAMLQDRFTLIEVTETETRAMGTNVFVVNPETVVVHAGHARIAQAIEAAGLRAEHVNYSEPNALLRLFRCSTMPLVRAA